MSILKIPFCIVFRHQEKTVPKLKIREVCLLSPKNPILKASICALVLFVLCLSGKTLAHHPQFVKTDISRLEDARIVSDPTTSQAIYATLAQGKVHYYQLETTEDQEIFVQMLIPFRPPNKDFRPRVALIGPGLPEPDGDVPFTIPQDSGALIFPWEDKEVFFEPFSQTRYYMAKEIRRSLPSGNWYVAVYHPEGKVGRYTLTIGEKDRWGVKEVLSFPAMWFRTRWWYSPGQTIAIILGVAALIALLTWLVKRRKR